MFVFKSIYLLHIFREYRSRIDSQQSYQVPVIAVGAFCSIGERNGRMPWRAVLAGAKELAFIFPVKKSVDAVEIIVITWL